MKTRHKLSYSNKLHLAGFIHLEQRIIAALVQLVCRLDIVIQSTINHKQSAVFSVSLKHRKNKSVYILSLLFVAYTNSHIPLRR